MYTKHYTSEVRGAYGYEVGKLLVVLESMVGMLYRLFSIPWAIAALSNNLEKGHVSYTKKKALGVLVNVLV